jgi:hypothetical protein
MSGITSVGRVEKVQQTTSVSDLEAEQLKKRLQLNDTETFERGGSADLGSFKGNLDAETQATIQALYGGMPTAQASALSAASDNLGAAILGAGTAGINSSALKTAASEAVALYVSGKGADQFATTQRDFTALALGGIESELSQFAKEVQTTLNFAKETRTTITELNDMAKDWPEGQKQTVEWDAITFDGDNKPTVTHHKEDLTKDQAVQLADDLDSQLKSINEISDLQKADLQQHYQDYNQANQLIAEIVKQMHDDAMKVLNNLK